MKFYSKFSLVLILAMFFIARNAHGQNAPNLNVSAGTSIWTSTAIVIDPDLTITDNGGGNFDGATINFSSGYINWQDILIYPSNLHGVTGTWDYSTGVLTLSGSATVVQYQEILRSIQYNNTTGSPTLGNRTVNITLGNAIPFRPCDATKDHFYRFVQDGGITWQNAKTAAEAQTYFGLQGYLSTIICAEENAFAFNSIGKEGWIGASDDPATTGNSDDQWYWACGPENGTQFWSGLSNGSPVSGRYNNWQTSPDQEPNNWNGIGESYAHFRDDGTWNDFTNTQYITGYYLEFGEMAGDAVIQITGSKIISVQAPPPMELVFTILVDATEIELTLYGTVNCTVDWGDATATQDFTSEGNYPHTFATAGTYTVTISGTLTQFGNSGTDWTGAEYLTEVVSFGELGLTSLSGAFVDADNLLSVPAALPTTVTDLSSAFRKTNQVSITNLNLWDVSAITSMSAMFYLADNFNQDIGGWTVSSVTDMGYMFYAAKAFNQNVGSWNVSSVLRIKDMFEFAEVFNQDLNLWTFNSSLTDMSNMFSYAKAFNGNITNWNVINVTNMSRMFQGAEVFNQDINGWDVDNVTSMVYMFLNAANFNQNINNWTVSSVTNMKGMFSNASTFNQDVSSWVITSVTNMTYMFDGVTLSTTNYDALLNGWSALTLQSGVTFSGGNSQYSCAAVDARASLLADDTWTITDNGMVNTMQAETANLDDVIAQCTVTELTAPTAIDACGETFEATQSDITLPFSTQGTFTIEWISTDQAGNTYSQTQTLIIDDTEAPETPTLANVTSECSVSTYTPTTTDNCAGTINGTTSTTFPIITQGTTIVTWTFEDESGNSVNANQNVVIEDITAPTPDVEPLMELTGECSVDDPGTPTGTDNCGMVTVTTTTVFPTGSDIVWTYDDGNGNTYTQTQTVTVADISAPVPDIADLPDLTEECSIDLSTYTPTATDNCIGTVNGTTPQTIFDTQGTYSITWTYEDLAGNTYSQTQTIIIDDITAPETPTLADVTGECTATATAPATTDNCAGEITGETTDALFYDTQGTYSITWTFDDNNGNITTYTQTVIVDDITNPETPTIDEVTGECSATATAPTTNDNCAGEITATTSDALFYDTQGTHIITWTFADGNGNSIEVEQTVTVADITNPTITCVEDHEVIADETETYTVIDTEFDPTATDDNCEVISVTNDINGTETLAGETLAQGETHIITWTVTDIAGNETSCEFDVLVNNFVGIADLSEIGINIYPNPTNGIVNINLSGLKDLSGLSLQITDVTGKVISNTTMEHAILQIDLSNHANGIYFIKFQNDEVVKTVKIIKQ